MLTGDAAGVASRQSRSDPLCVAPASLCDSAIHPDWYVADFQASGVVATIPELLSRKDIKKGGMYGQNCSPNDAPLSPSEDYDVGVAEGGQPPVFVTVPCWHLSP